ncbi:MAG: toll/interleukin-1 receptor domain-containing protein [Rubrivivax sp.]|nr:toll/interleukin-1 receptor domain-containing protein [Rubrivivax sp.]
MKAFLSYRRADSQATAGRMAQFLDGIPAVDEVFLDVDGIAPGENFERKIQDTLAQVSHAFVLIGLQWAGPAGAGGKTRLFDDDDMVRREVRLALASRARLVPILLDDTRMPRPADLPPDLKALSSINAFSLRTAHFDEDMDDLLDALLGTKAGGRKGRGSRWRQAPLTLAGAAWRVAAGLAAGAVLMVGAGLANRWADNGCPHLVCTLQSTFGITAEADALGLLWMIGIAVLALSAAAPFVLRWWSGRR